MATANITRDEAIARSRVISTDAYRVTVDLTGREVAEPERVFLSTTELSLTAHGGDTYVDLIADEVREASLDGEPFDTAGFDGYRLPLPHLEEGPHQVRVVAVCRYSNSGEGLHRFIDPADGRTYLYSQFEAADARRMYATAEQPDQKATFQLTVLAPLEWLVFTNAPSVAPSDFSQADRAFRSRCSCRPMTFSASAIQGSCIVFS